MTEQNNVINKASDIIERFGGIRPMSTKTGIPVTTIQGWKQRNAIPANRRDELIDAANRHGVMLGDLLMEIAGDHNAIPAEDNYAAAQPLKRSADPDLRPANNQPVLIVAGVLVLVAAIAGGVMVVLPKLNSFNEQNQRILELEQQIAAMRNAQQTVQAEEPSALSQKIASLEGQLANVSEQAKSYATVAHELKSGNMAQRLSMVEGRVGGLLQQANMNGLKSIMGRVTSLQSTTDGQIQIQDMMTAFMGVNAESKQEAAQKYATLKTTNPHIAETFKDVAPEDMQAAVMLMGMTQLRQSLARDNASFDKDLQILKSTLARDNPELQAAIDRLSPQAKTGVLTPDGLSRELRGLTNEIVEASLTGQDISIQDKALARLNNVVKVEKDGQQISGTETQRRIADAQKKLDAGDIQGAVALLQNMDAPAAAKAKPVIDAAQATLLATQVKNLIGTQLITSLKGMGRPSPNYTTGGGMSAVTQDMDAIINQVKSMGMGAIQ